MNHSIESNLHHLGRPSLPLKGRVALVTGGARGIGRGICVELLRAGAHVVIADLVERDMAETCEQLSALRTAGAIDWVKLDVSDPESIRAGVAAARERCGSIEILVNNAGVAKPGLFAEEEPRGIRNALAVDLAGAVCLTRLVLPEIVERGWGRIVNISSMMAFSGSPGFAVYSAAKAGLLGFSEAIERELRGLPDVRVTAVVPPSVRTRAFDEAKRDQPGLMRWGLVPPVSVEQIARRTVRGAIAGRRRIYGSAQSYLASLVQRAVPWLMDRILMYMFRPPSRPRLPAHTSRAGAHSSKTPANA
ncbi:MAG: SDR family NAD(P)-dependent oxidoreductase [Polyangiaceae bacterium]